MSENPRPRPRIIDKQRPEATKTFRKKQNDNSHQQDKTSSGGVPNKLRHGADEAFQILARKNAAMGGM